MNTVYRNGQFCLFLLSLGVLASSYYFQYMEELTPCPLCLMQRLCTFIITIICFLSWLTIKSKNKICAILQLIFCILGIYFAARQLWLMSLPPQDTGACLPGLNMMLRYFPLHETLRALFLGSADCREVQWEWLGLSMPAWSLLYFIFVLGSVFLLYHFRYKKPPS